VHRHEEFSHRAYSKPDRRGARDWPCGTGQTKAPRGQARVPLTLRLSEGSGVTRATGGGAPRERGVGRHAATQRPFAYFSEIRHALLPELPAFGSPMSRTATSDSHLTFVTEQPEKFGSIFASRLSFPRLTRQTSMASAL
jgi:hypothetical protein